MLKYLKKKRAGFVLTMGLGMMLLASPLQAAPTDSHEGTFSCLGQLPAGKGQYRGMVEISPTGETYTVLWRIGAATYIGTGIFENGVFAVAYLTKDRTWFGLALFKKQGTKWIGHWTEGGSKTVGTEVWEH